MANEISIISIFFEKNKSSKKNSPKRIQATCLRIETYKSLECLIECDFVNKFPKRKTT